MRIATLKDYPLDLALHEAPELVSDVIAETGAWEPFETRVISSLLRPGDTFVDVGANLGYFSAIAAGLVGNQGRVIAFEPDADNFALLTRNTAAFSWVTCHACALSNRAGRSAFVLSSDNRGDHRLADEAQHQVDVISGDEIIEGRVDVVKIDTQGAEARVLQGLAATLERSSDHLSLIVEFWPAALAQLGATGRDVLDCLEPLGLDTWIIDHEGHQLVPATIDQLDGLASTLMAPETGGFMNILAARHLPPELCVAQ